MSSTHYKQLISYMPSMAAVVNSFQSPEVQLVAFQRLIGALDDALNIKPNSEPPKLSRSASTPSSRNGHGSGDSDIEITHDLVEGESIHSAIGD
jgi:hypothetical protein